MGYHNGLPFGKKDELMFTIHAHPTLSKAMLDAYAAVECQAINA
jgi:dihydrolipoamide dehydrogenase